MNKDFNTIVVGLGAMGSAALYQLAQRNVRALGIDIFSPPHAIGSTHGDTRITRQAIGEGAHYTPLSLRSYEIFREVERKTETKLLQVTGGLIIASESKEASIIHVPGFFENTLAAARKYDIRHEVLTAEEIRKKFPQFNVDDDELGYYEYEAGFLRPELAVRAQLDLAVAGGATVHTGERFLRFDEHDDGVTVHTDRDSYCAEHLILTVGPWLPETVGELASIFKVHRQVLFWFDIAPSFSDFSPERFPVFLWHIKGTESGIYGFPAVDGPAGGFKIASGSYAGTVTPDTVDRTVSAEETKAMFERKVAPFLPQASARCVKSAVCLYTVTPDGAFVIDWPPRSKRVLLCSSCSGHGFKHSAAIGECIAELVCGAETTLDISAFKLERLLGNRSSVCSD